MDCLPSNKWLEFMRGSQINAISYLVLFPPNLYPAIRFSFHSVWIGFHTDGRSNPLFPLYFLEENQQKSKEQREREQCIVLYCLWIVSGIDISFRFRHFDQIFQEKWTEDLEISKGQSKYIIIIIWTVTLEHFLSCPSTNTLYRYIPCISSAKNIKAFSATGLTKGIAVVSYICGNIP